MAAPYNNGYMPDPVQRAPSPYDHTYAPDPNQRAPSPYQQGSSNSYYEQHPQANAPNFAPTGQPQYNETPAAEGEKGLIGAIGGGLTGGYIGKQTCHGFLGTVGGAMIGSLTEDWAKKKKPLCGRPTTPTQHPPQCPPAAPHPCNTGPMYSPPIVDTTTTMSSSTHVHPGQWQPPPPVYQNPPPKPCGHHHPCGCNFFGKH